MMISKSYNGLIEYQRNNMNSLKHFICNLIVAMMLLAQVV